MALKRILVVEDDKLLSTLSGMFVGELGYDLAGRYQSGEAMLDDLDELRPDMVLMDVQIKGGYNGIETACQLRARKNIPVVFLTGDLYRGDLEKIVTEDFYGYLRKPFTKTIFEEAIKLAYVKHQYEQNNPLIVNNPGLTAIIRQNGYISYASEAFKTFFQLSDQQIRNYPMKFFLMENLQEDFASAVHNSFVNNVALNAFTFNIRSRNGKIQTHQFAGALLYFKNEKCLYLSVL